MSFVFFRNTWADTCSSSLSHLEIAGNDVNAHGPTGPSRESAAAAAVAARARRQSTPTTQNIFCIQINELTTRQMERKQ
jgi:hypothetical protein